jgi:hypothetical protein
MVAIRGERTVAGPGKRVGESAVLDAGHLMGAQQMRPSYVLGAFALVAVGLVGVACARQLALWLLQLGESPLLNPRIFPDRPRPQIHILARELVSLSGVLVIAGLPAGLGALVALGSVEPRPGPYPGGAFTDTGAVVALAALAYLELRQLWVAYKSVRATGHVLPSHLSAAE